MCGRISQHSDVEAVAKQFGVAESHRPREALEPRYNIAPGAGILAVRLDGQGERELVRLKWGLVPSWSVEPKTSYSTFNAKAETVDSKPAFRAAFKRQRCIVPIDGWYEWAFVPGAKYKQPWYYRRPDGEPLALAGVWDRWTQRETVLETCTVIVCPANRVTSAVHDRMPAILGQEDWAAWLDPTYSPAEAKAMLRPCPNEWITGHPVGQEVSSARNEGPRLCEPNV
jgi:putative SOS response-associated peptidase YedK